MKAEKWEYGILCAINVKGMYRGVEGKAPVTVTCPEGRWGPNFVRVELESKGDGNQIK